MLITENTAARPPGVCYAAPLSDPCQIVRIYRGSAGFYAFWKANSDKDAAQIVKDLNKSLGVSDIEAEAMINGFMFGWSVPGADSVRLARVMADAAARQGNYLC